MTLWAIESAPLILGSDLRSLDAADLRLLFNEDVIGVDQAGMPAHPLSQATPQQVWFGQARGGGLVVALFNLAAAESPVSVRWSDLGLSGRAEARDLWSHTTVARGATGFTATLPPHGSRLLRVRPRD